MSTLTLSFSRTMPRNIRLGSPIARLAREWNYWRARRAMAGLGDDALHDMGVGRSEIEDVVRHGRPERHGA